eukprot:gene11389-biopygen252
MNRESNTQSRSEDRVSQLSVCSLVILTSIIIAKVTRMSPWAGIIFHHGEDWCGGNARWPNLSLHHSSNTLKPQETPLVPVWLLWVQ